MREVGVTAQGDAKRSARLFGAAEALHEAIGEILEPEDRAEYDRYRAIARAALTEEAFAAAWAKGRAMTIEQAIAEALELARTLLAAGRTPA